MGNGSDFSCGCRRRLGYVRRIGRRERLLDLWQSRSKLRV
jgi:hypothetical protein